MNLALLNKWKWRILNESNKPWEKILCSRYDNVKIKVLVCDINMLTSKDSIWWQDIITTNKGLNSADFNFEGDVRSVVGNDIDTALWQTQ